ncbi:hypothetical protein MPSEU_000279200 [Mayamaea pseudoterrestris]|nr:hypothetical protein MPSEU_000279200 [Mayamaea pseudoterrestris]
MQTDSTNNDNMKSESSQIDDSVDKDLPKVHMLAFVDASASVAGSDKAFLDLLPGENWLILRVNAKDNLAKSPCIHNTQQFAGIIPEDSPNNFAFMTLDIDGQFAAIKDLRLDDNNHDNETEVFIERSKKAGTENGPSMEKLERRRLVHLFHKDRLMIRINSDASDHTMVLEYRHDFAIRMASLADISSAPSTEQTLAPEPFFTAREIENNSDPVDSVPDNGAKPSLLNKMKSIADQLVTQPEYMSDKDIDMTEPQVQSGTDELLMSQPGNDNNQPYPAEHDDEEAPQPEQSLSDEETVDPDEEAKPELLTDTENMQVDDAAKPPESEATYLLSPPPDTMGDTEPINPPTKEIRTDDERLSFVGEDDEDDLSNKSDSAGQQASKRSSWSKSLSNRRTANRGLTAAKNPSTFTTPAATLEESDAEADDDETRRNKAIGSFLGVEVVAAQGESKRKNLKAAKGKPEEAKTNAGKGSDSKTKPVIPLINAMIGATRANTSPVSPTRQAPTFDYEGGTSFDEGDATLTTLRVDVNSNDDHDEQSNAGRFYADNTFAQSPSDEHNGALEPELSVDMTVDATNIGEGNAKHDTKLADDVKAVNSDAETTTKPSSRSHLSKSKAKSSTRETKKSARVTSGSTTRRPARKTCASFARTAETSTKDVAVNESDGEMSFDTSKTVSKAALSPSAGSSRPKRKRQDKGAGTVAATSPLTRLTNKKMKTDEHDIKEVRIIATKVQLTNKQLKMIDKIPGASWITETEHAHEATHVIASDGKQQLKRTPKLMIALNKTPNIVTLDWFTECAKKGAVLPCDTFLVNDKRAEKEYDFVMNETLDRITEHLENGIAVLTGKHVYVCKGVAGNKAPKEDEFKCIVEAAGGEWLPNLKTRSGIQKEDVIIITNCDSTEEAKQTKVTAVASAIRQGAQQKTTSWLFKTMMTQHLDIDSSA